MTVLTEKQAFKLLDALRTIEGIKQAPAPDHDSALAEVASGRVAMALDVASDAVFNVLNQAASYGHCVEADAAIKRWHSRSAIGNGEPVA